MLACKGIPPSHYKKQLILKRYARKYNLKVLIETGTYLGNMIKSTKNTFERIYSIELDDMFYLRAIRKFKEYKHISIIQGDSGEKLKEVLKAINQPVLYWLDAHHFGGITGKGIENTPIIKELEQIFSHNNPDDLILIDDARHFDGTNDYPTLKQLESYIEQINPNYRMKVEKGIVIIEGITRC
jgi:hypothetical protein